MAKFRELEMLKEQEKTLVQLHMTFSDQLNRLKVEELALTNLLRLQQEKQLGTNRGLGPGQPEQNAAINTKPEQAEPAHLAALNLNVHQHATVNDEEEEEEEESEEGGQDDEEDDGGDSYQDQLHTFLEDLLIQQQEQHQQDAVKQETAEEEEEDMEEEDDGV